MIGEPDAGNLHVRFDEGAQETCGSAAARLCPTLQRPEHLTARVFCARYQASPPPHFHTASASTKFGKSSNTQLYFKVR
jgi:hypothetical protein